MLTERELRTALELTVRQYNYLRWHGFFTGDEVQQIDEAIGPGNNVFTVIAPAADGSRMYIVVSYPCTDAAACREEADRVAGICADNGVAIDTDDLQQRFWGNDLREDIVV